MDGPRFNKSFEEESENEDSIENQEISNKKGYDLSSKQKINIKNEELFWKNYIKMDLHMYVQIVTNKI